MLAAIADEDLGRCAMAEARLTHHDPLADEVTAAVNMLCRALIRGTGWEDALRQGGLAAGHGAPGHNGGFAPDVLRAAVFFIGTSVNFSKAQERSLAFAGPPTIVRSSWAQPAVPAGEHQPSRNQGWLMSIFCPGTGRPRRRWSAVRCKWPLAFLLCCQGPWKNRNRPFSSSFARDKIRWTAAPTVKPGGLC